MSNNYFKFKKFTIEQDGCAMKVGTDGCLLGAWFDTYNCKRILDIGAGTGLISIMAAQRCPAATITGIEIDCIAAQRATENVKNSPWSERVEIVNIDINDFTAEERFDAIVSNPPYFSQSLKCDNEQRTLARHNDSLTPESFFRNASLLLAEDGRISIIIPSDALDEWASQATFKGFSVHRITRVHTTPRKEAKRVLVEFRKSVCTAPLTEKLILETAPGEYSPEATAMLKDFYLKLD